MELSSLIKKIGHFLVEIRVRALKNIISKLDHSLISVSDIVQEKMLFVYLLEWFNFPEVPMKEEVLELLTTLSKHSSAAQMLRDVGAVDFLTQLSPNVDPGLQAVISGVLDQLFHLPDFFPSQTVAYSHGPHDAASTVHESVKCLKFSVFPWLTLTNTDRHILSSNESSLRSNKINLVQSTCDLLRDVIMQDFPPEIFLQRPSIVKNLLSLLRVDLGKVEPNHLHLQALSCLRQLCAGLRRRLRFHQDPSFCSTKQDPVSQNSSFSYNQDVQETQHSQGSSPGGECSPRPSVVGRSGQRPRGDGQDGDAASTSGSSSRGSAMVPSLRQVPQSPAGDMAHLEIPDLGVEDVLELQLQQLTLAQFTVTVMEHVIPFLKTEILHVFHHVLELLCDTILLLGGSVCEVVWDDRSLVGIELREKLQAFMELLGDILSYHCSFPADIPQSSQIHHRMAYIGTAIFTIRLLQTILPSEKAGEILPDSTATAILQVCLDASLGSLFPSVQETAVAYLEQVNSDHYDLYRRVNRAALWMESACNFVKEAQAEGDKNWLEILELADQAVDGFPFHQHLPIVKECVLMCSHFWTFEHPGPVLQTMSQDILLKLLSHPLLPVKMETYTCTLNLVKECIGIQNVARQESGVCGGISFLLHHRVLYEISAFGLQDSAEKVNTAAKDILLFLLKGRLMMTASSWDRFNEALYPVMPILQGYACTEDSLGKCVLLLSDIPDIGEDNTFPSVTKLKAALRLLFTKRPTVRMAALQQVIPYLTGADESTTTRPVLDQPVISALPNLFFVKRPLDIELDMNKVSVLKVESVEKLFCVLSSNTIDISLRRSAAEQLSVVLQDSRQRKHACVCVCLFPLQLKTTSMYVAFSPQSTDCLLEPCVCILRKLLYADPSLRHSLAQHNLLLLTLLRASLILKENKNSGDEISVLMSLLLFDEISDAEMWSDKSSTNTALPLFSLPLTVIRRYNIPFQTTSHHAVSPYCCVLPSSSDLLTLAPACQFLQVAWNTAWHSGIDNLLDELQGASSKISEFHPDLKLSESQVLALQAIHPPTALQDCIQTIVSAAGHRSVTSALSRLSLYLVIDRLALPHTPALSCLQTLDSLSWQTAVTRFLQVRPACIEDERLLVDVLAFLSAYFKQTHTESASDQRDKDLRWILELLLNQTQASTENTGEPQELKNRVSQRLQRELTSFFNTLLLCLTRTTDRLTLTLAGPFKSQLSVCLLQSLRVSDAPCFYGLPSLERTLQGMVSLTAQPGWSSHCHDWEPSSLCSKYLSGLLEVISSFYVEWGGNSMSFMGKGVTKNAVICLLQLSHEMLAENKDKNFISQWTLSNDVNPEEASASQLGLTWLIPLWVDRDQEVRFASLALGGALSTVPSGCKALCVGCQNISGVFCVCVFMCFFLGVCVQATFILQNLLVMPMAANTEEAKDSDWQHPCVHDEVSSISLVGLPALKALLYHCQYFQHVARSASICYQGRYTFPIIPAVPLENKSLGKNQRPSSSLSTSSTSVSHSECCSNCLFFYVVGQSDTDTSNSVTYQDSRRGGPSSAEPIVIVTPDLLTAHCGLLTNLLSILSDFTLTAIQDNQLLQALARYGGHMLLSVVVNMWQSTLFLIPSTPKGSLSFVTLLQFLSSFSKLLQSCVTVSSDLVAELNFLKRLLPKLVSLLMLDISGLAAGTRDTVCLCWADVFMLLATLVRRDSSAAYPSVSAALGKCWQTFTGTLSVCLTEKFSDPLHAVALQFLSTVFTEETSRRQRVTASNSNSVHETSLSDIVNGPSATQLCELLLQNFDKKTLQNPLKKLTARALMTLLACSPTSQNYAAKAGLIDSCVEQLKQTHSQLHLESVRPGKAAHRRKVSKDWLLFSKIRLSVEILRSALYLSDECKVVASDSRLTLALYALWPWLLLDDPTMEAVLELLCVYTAHCTTGLYVSVSCSYVCATVPSGSKGTSSGSLMLSVMKLASCVAQDNSSVQKLAFALLTNLAISRDCRGVFQKNNFLQALTSVPLPRAGGVKATAAAGAGNLLTLWLKLLLNLSLAEDIQQCILRVSGVLELLADLAPHRRHALLTLHNLCFCPANKPHIIANAMKAVLHSLESKDLETRCMGSSALWALLHNNQRVYTHTHRNTLTCTCAHALNVCACAYCALFELIGYVLS
uniref:Rotatin n=1 Tax=Cynoglossus semilaevis TaxID=244447 RepID=A0A3P8VNZ8_CYNSE